MAELPVRNAATYLLAAMATLAAIATYTTFFEELEATCFGRWITFARCLNAIFRPEVHCQFLNPCSRPGRRTLYPVGGVLCNTDVSETAACLCPVWPWA